MALVVEDLVFVTNGGAGRSFCASAGDRVEVWLHEIFDAAVRAGRDLEIRHQLEAGITLARDDVAAGAGFLAVARLDGAHAVLERTVPGGEVIRFRAAPAVGGFAVPEEFPAVVLLLVGEGVWRRLVCGE